MAGFCPATLIRMQTEVPISNVGNNMGNMGKRLKSARLWLLGLAIAVLLSSCNSYLADGVRVAWAKQLFRQGSYQEALLYFLKAERGRQNSIRQQLGKVVPGDSRMRALRRIRYNIGLVYSALGQSQASLESWQSIIDRGGLDSDPTLQFNLLYNTGLLYSQVGQNEYSRRYLVQALELRPESDEARQALELCLERLRHSQLARQSAQRAQKEELAELPPSQASISDEQILNYISRQANYRFQRDAPARKVLRNDW